jgi:HSP20 family protein
MDMPTRRENEMTSWNPFRELDEIQSRMSRLLESTLGNASTSLAGAWTPPVDIEETDDAYVVEVELPEVKREDIDVELNDNELSIHGEIKERERTGIIRRQTRRSGQFDYRVTLPGQVDPESTEASLKDGVLRLTLHKSEGQKRRRIEISSN